MQQSEQKKQSTPNSQLTRLIGHRIRLGLLQIILDLLLQILLLLINHLQLLSQPNNGIACRLFGVFPPRTKVAHKARHHIIDYVLISFRWFGIEFGDKVL